MQGLTKEEIQVLAVETREAEQEKFNPPPIGNLYTSDHILSTDWPEPVWAVPNLLPAGLCFLAGKPKVGKSWLGLQIALAKAAGGMALGERVEAGPVLYLALEDSGRRLKDRMEKQGWTKGLKADFLTLEHFNDKVGFLNEGGAESLAEQVKAKDYHLVVIDTLSRAISGDQSDVGLITQALSPLQSIAHEHNAVVLMVDHHKKGNGKSEPDAITDILGSTAKGATADCIWGLYKEPGKVSAVLRMVGRDVEEKALSLSMDWTAGCWQNNGDSDAIQVTEQRRVILDFLKEGGPAGLMDVVKALGKSEKEKGNVHITLQDMCGQGLLQREKKSRSVRYHSLDKEV